MGEDSIGPGQEKSAWQTRKDRSLCVVKMKLKSFLRDDYSYLADRIEIAVQSLSLITFEASRIANLYALSCLQNGREISFRNLFRNAACQVSRSGTSKTGTHRGLQEVYSSHYLPLRPEELPLPSRLGLRQAITMAAQQWETNAINMVQTNTYSRLRNWTKLQVFKFTSANQEAMQMSSYLPSSEVNRLVTSMMDGFVKNEPPRAAAIASLGSELREQLSTWHLSVRDSYPRCFPMDIRKTTFERYYPLLYKISKVFSDHVLQRKAEGKLAGKGIKPFSMMPLRGYSAIHISLDTDGFADFLKYNISTEQQMPLKDCLWTEVFDIDRIQSHKDGKRRFAGSIATDGVSVSIRVEKGSQSTEASHLPEDEKIELLTETETQTWMQKNTSKLDKEVKRAVKTCPEDIEQTLYIDPGTDDMAYAVSEEDCKDKPVVRKASTAEYRHLASMDRANQLRTRWAQNSGLEFVNEDTPSAKVASVDGLVSHISFVLPHLLQMISHYGSKKRRNLGFTTYRRKEGAMRTMVKKVVPDENVKTLVVYGAADFCHAAKGRVASPYRKLRARINDLPNVTMVMIGECNSSKLCSRCHREMGHAKKETVKEGVVKKRNIHTVKVCNHCSTTWNRDLNATKNFRYVFSKLRAGEQRPDVFRPKRRICINNSEEGA